MSLSQGRRRWWPEVALLVAGYLAYREIRGSVGARQGEAQHNASLLVGSTPSAIAHLELLANRVATAHDAIAVGTALYYVTLHLPVTVGVLVWLWWSRPTGYAESRTALALASVLGLLGFWLFPVEPPRLHGPGLTDTVAAVQRSWGGGSGQPDGFVNHYAAFPSLHLAWACWCAWCVARWTSFRRRGVVWFYPAATAIVLVATANHYVLDLVAGVAVFAVAAALAGVHARWWSRRVDEAVPMTGAEARRAPVGPR